jgi:hypothetical protein
MRHELTDLEWFAISGSQQPQTLGQPSGGRRLDQDRHQDGDEGDGRDHLPGNRGSIRRHSASLSQ